MDLYEGEVFCSKFVEYSANYNYPPVLKFYAGPFPMVITSNPEGVKEILVNKRNIFVKGSLFQALKDYMGDALFNIEGEVWNRHRHTINPAFKTEALRNIADEIFSKHGVLLVNKWKQQCSNGEPVDLVSDTSTLTFDIITEAAFGHNAHCFTERNAELYHSMKYITEKALYLTIPGKKIFFSNVLKKFDQSIKTVYAAIQSITADDSLEGSSKSNILKMMTQSGKFTNAEMKDETIGMALAGHDTTASNLVWTIISLCQNPHVQKKVQEEIDSVLGKKTPGWDDAHSLPYLRAVVLESHRFYPIINMLNRECIQDEEVCGYFVPKGTNMFYSPEIIHQDPNVYESPQQFMPERFLKEERQSTEFPAFGAGSRMCIGKQFAQNEAIILLACIYQTFSTKLVKENISRKWFATVICPTEKTVMVNLTLRNT